MMLNFDSMTMADVKQFAETPQSAELRDGDYIVAAVDVKESRNKPGTLCVWLEVIAGPSKSRRFWVFFDTNNPRRVRELYSYCVAAGLTGCADSSDLLNRPVQVTVVVKPSTNPNYPEPQVYVNQYAPAPATASTGSERTVERMRQEINQFFGAAKDEPNDDALPF